MAYVDKSGLSRAIGKLLEIINSRTGLPVGFEFFQTNPNARAGTLPLKGGVFSRSEYPQLWSWVQSQGNYLISESEWQSKASKNDGPVPFYSKGNGSTTFRVPDLSLPTFYHVTYDVSGSLAGTGQVGSHYVVATSGAVKGV